MKIRIRKASDGSGEEIFCAVRKKWIISTPEEIVRQWFIIVLTEKYNIPLGYITVERGFTLEGGKFLRADILVSDNKGIPSILVECKAKDVKIDEEVFRQASKYNAYFHARNIILTNSLVTRIFSTENFIDYREVNVE